MKISTDGEYIVFSFSPSISSSRKTTSKSTLDTEIEKASSLAVCMKPVCYVDSEVFLWRLKISYILRKNTAETEWYSAIQQSPT